MAQRRQRKKKRKKKKIIYKKKKLKKKLGYEVKRIGISIIPLYLVEFFLLV